MEKFKDNPNINPEDKAMARVLGEIVMIDLLQTWPTVSFPIPDGGNEMPTVSTRKPVSEFMLNKPA
jgi:hypothetical protein